MTENRPQPTRASERSGLGYQPRYDVHDYELLPDDGKRHELIDGDLFMTPAPSVQHQAISRNLLVALATWARGGEHGLVYAAPIDVELGPHDVLQPDLVFVSRARAAIVTAQRIVGAPDLVIEILSASTAERDRDTKRKTYARAGVREYWLVDPGAQTLVRFQLEAHEGLVETESLRPGQTVRSPLLPGLALPLDPLLAGDLA